MSGAVSGWHAGGSVRLQPRLRIAGGVRRPGASASEIAPAGRARRLVRDAAPIYLVAAEMAFVPPSWRVRPAVRAGAAAEPTAPVVIRFDGTDVLMAAPQRRFRFRPVFGVSVSAGGRFGVRAVLDAVQTPEGWRSAVDSGLYAAF